MYTKEFSCGCKIKNEGVSTIGFYIEYCPLHQSAPDLHKSLKQLVWALDTQGEGKIEHALTCARATLITLGMALTKEEVRK